jgi:hypothetical protein
MKKVAATSGQRRSLDVGLSADCCGADEEETRGWYADALGNFDGFLPVKL